MSANVEVTGAAQRPESEANGVERRVGFHFFGAVVRRRNGDRKAKSSDMQPNKNGMVAAATLPIATQAGTMTIATNFEPVKSQRLDDAIW